MWYGLVWGWDTDGGRHTIEHRKRDVGVGCDVYGHTIYPVSSGAFGYLRTYNGSMVKAHYGSDFSM